MSDAEVFKHCLRLVKVDHGLAASSSAETALQPILADILRCFCTSEYLDKCKAFPFVISTSTRLLSKSINAPVIALQSLRNICDLLNCMENVVDDIFKDASLRKDLFMYSQDSVLHELWLSLLSLFHVVSEHFEKPVGTMGRAVVFKGTHSDIEYIIQCTYNLYRHIIRLAVCHCDGCKDTVGNCSHSGEVRMILPIDSHRQCSSHHRNNLHDRLQTTNVLAQTIQSFLFTVNAMPQKQLVKYALQLILCSLQVMSTSVLDIENWCTFYPGICSAMVACCASTNQNM
jgi:hypothetical protein